MERFTKTKVVKLRSYHDTFLFAGDDSETVRHSRGGSSARNTKWMVEIVQDKERTIRLRSMAGKYLAASDEPLLLGLTGRKIFQIASVDSDDRTEWEVLSDGFQVRLKSWCGKFLRANGGTPPWKNTVTHDEPRTGATTRWVLWDVVPLIGGDGGSLGYIEYVPDAASDDDRLPVSGTSSPVIGAASPARLSVQKSFPRFFKGKINSVSSNRVPETPAMDFFHNAKAVRLRCHHDKYLFADDDEETVTQDRSGSSKCARWTVEIVQGTDSIIRLKSCFGKYLTASNQPFLLGMTGRKVTQTLPTRLDSSLEWEPVREGNLVKLKTRYGNYLRANGGVPPWRNSVTHDIPNRSATQDWILWRVDVVEIHVLDSPKPHPVPQHQDSLDFEPSSPTSGTSARYSRQESTDSFAGSPPKSEGRTIYYHVAEEGGEVEEDTVEPYHLLFKGNSVDELTSRLMEETGLDDVVVCVRSRLNGKLYPLRLQLPPNNSDMHVVVVPAASLGEA